MLTLNDPDHVDVVITGFIGVEQHHMDGQYPQLNEQFRQVTDTPHYGNTLTVRQQRFNAFAYNVMVIYEDYFNFVHFKASAFLLTKLV
jgi:hypothetical protein